MTKNRMEIETEDAGKFYKLITNQNNIILLYTILNFQGKKVLLAIFWLKNRKNIKKIKNIS